jgi:hypothetical protein
MTDSFWERRTTFWHDKEPSAGPAQATDEASFWKDKEPLKVTAAGAEARSEAGSRVIRRLRRIRTSAGRRRLLALGALASAAVIVFAYAFLTSDVSRSPDGGRAARAADDAQTGGGASSPTLGPLFNALPLASVTGAPRDLAAAPGAAPAAGVDPSQAAVGGGGTGASGTSAPSTSAASAPARASASAPAGGPPPAASSPPGPAPAPAPTSPPTTAPPAPPPPPPPSCTIGLLGTCVVGGGGLLP